MPYVEEAFRVLLNNKVRSLLTIAGLIIGVAAVIAIQVAGKGMATAVGGLLGTLNDRAFVLFPSQQTDFRRAAITVSDLTAIKNTVTGVVEAEPAGNHSDVIHVGHNLFRLRVSPESENRFNTVPLAQGRGFTADDVSGSTMTCVITDNAFHKFFPDGGDVVGRSLYVGPDRYEIVGVLQKPTSGILNFNFGGDVTIPYTTFIRKYVRHGVVYAGKFIVADNASIPDVEVAVLHQLQQLHHNVKNARYQTFDRQSFSQSVNTIFGAITLIVGLIGAISLVVAGIGIMNIMLVSVTERTREIGVRKAIGARRSQVLIQFFVEALALSGVGCLIGLVLGLVIGYLVNTMAVVKLTGYVAPLPWLQASIVAVSFAAIVTLAFGTYPAFRAASLDPIEALRYE